ncbi:thiamine-phosphate kinase [uncultured Rikenella sp.]|uniref:thiamine-phosphate kinase n=1 Tax=uncultured Rikenella sp. TaxID=368003 RepID=UPI002625D6CA|nr:thiamine-phosphate kinase [uncultured Rikenella sp.]
MKIDEIGEFGLIGRIAAAFRPLVPTGWEGIGDDCAVIPWSDDRSMIVTTDLLIENVHFLRDRISAYDLGYKALAVNLSDVAAMGATPAATFLSLGLPADGVGVEWCDRFFEGYRSFGVPLLGGDTTASPQGIVVNVTVLGIAENDRIKRRSGAEAGDLIVVTGPLGDSSAGLQALLADLPTTPEIAALIEAHHRPRPHLAEGEWLGREADVHALMDVSDGVASDLGHILRASGVGAEIDTASLPVSDRLRKTATEQGWKPLKLALTGGEDYVLLGTVAPTRFEELQARFTARFGQPLAVIGRCVAGPAEIRYDGKPLDFSGFKHF